MPELQKRVWPRLYGEGSKGNTKEWEIRVEEHQAEVGPEFPDGAAVVVIHTEFGATGAKMQHTSKNITEGKNIGKANETTPFQQACNEAQSDWDKKVKKGYRESMAALKGLMDITVMTESGASAAKLLKENFVGEVNDEKTRGELVDFTSGMISGKPILPMLAHTYEKRKKDIVFPAFAQAKIDGHRAYGTGAKLLSRGGDPVPGYPNMPHLQKEMELFCEFLPDGVWYDGELYTQELPFEMVSRCIRKAKAVDDLVPLIPLVKFYVFDLFDPSRPEWPADERQRLLKTRVANTPGLQHIIRVPVQVVHNEEELLAFHDECVAAGFEGVIVRNMAGLYMIGHRSKDVQKHKNFKDEEFIIVNFKEAMDHTYDRNKKPIELPTVVWMCQTQDGNEFEVRPTGSLSYRHNLLANGDKHVGKKLIVRYQNMTEYNVPRFPVGKGFREKGS